LADECGQRFKLPRIGRPVNAAEEDQFVIEQLLGDRLVGGEHELLDDLMALGVDLQMSADDAALFVEIDLKLRTIQLQGAPAETPFAERHRKGEHPLEETVDLGGEVREDACGSAWLRRAA